MTKSLSPKTLNLVRDALQTDMGMTPKEIYAVCPGIALITVRHAIRELTALGEVRYTGGDMHRQYFNVVKEDA